MIKLENICFKYDNAKEDTLKSVDLSMNDGDILAVVGPSGGGKSTLLRIIAGLEKPQKGAMYLGERKIIGEHTFVVPEKRGIGMVFQDYALFPHMTVYKNIEYGMFKMTKVQKRQRVKEMLALVNLEEMENRYPFELSGGQQQRIALARALAPRPEILLLDEPFSNLDTHLLKKIRDELFEIIAEVGITTIMVTHNPEDAREKANRIVRIEKGVAKEIAEKELWI